MNVTSEEIKQYLLDSLNLDFGYILVTDELETWPSLSWARFKDALECQEINVERSINRNWKNFFYLEKEKYLLLQKLSLAEPFLKANDLLQKFCYN